MTCRVCGSRGAIPVGILDCRPHGGFEVFDCTGCGCRFTRHATATYEALHQGESGYQAHDETAERAAAFFRRGDTAALTRMLRRTPAIRFVLDEVVKSGRRGKILEIGCSRGALGSAFIAMGFDYLGVDISQVAVESARKRFGPHFEVAGSLDALGGRTFDAIVHVGTIGCVADPTGMVLGSLQRLSPGGVTAFNAPCVAESRAVGALWQPTTKPPDLVTLFERDFWHRQFPGVSTRTTIEAVPITEIVVRRRRRGLVADAPDPGRQLRESGHTHEIAHMGGAERLRFRAEGAARRLLAALPRLDAATATIVNGAKVPANLTRVPSSYGVHVSMRTA